MEIWKRWIPEGSEELGMLELYSINVLDDKDALTFSFKNKKNTKKVLFIFNNKELLSHRETEEGNLLKTQDYIFKYAEEEPFQGWRLFTIGNSKYLEWFHEQTLGMYDNASVKHYFLFTFDIMIEVLSLSDPKIEIEEMG